MYNNLVKPVLINMPSDILEAMTDLSHTTKRPRTKLIMDGCRLLLAQQNTILEKTEKRGWLGRNNDSYLSSGTGIT